MKRIAVIVMIVASVFLTACSGGCPSSWAIDQPWGVSCSK